MFRCDVIITVLQGSGCDGGLARLNSRIQATTCHPINPSTTSQSPSRPPSAVARPVASLDYGHNPSSAAQHSMPESSQPLVLVESHGVLVVQSRPGAEKGCVEQPLSSRAVGQRAGPVGHATCVTDVQLSQETAECSQAGRTSMSTLR